MPVGEKLLSTTSRATALAGIYFLILNIFIGSPHRPVFK